MRRNLRWVVMAVVLFLVGGGVFLVSRSMWEQHRADLAIKTLEMLPGVTQHLQDFRRVQVKDGRKVWEISAKDARFFEKDAIVVVQKPLVAWYLDDGRRLGLKGDEGRVVMADKEVQFVEMRGAIEVDLAEMRIEATEAVYDHQNQLISSVGRVQIAGRYLDVSGDEMVVDLGANKIEISENVTMTLQPSALAAESSNGRR